MKKIVVDVDGTICTQEKDYNNAKPLMNRIEFINNLHAEGLEVEYFTARGTKTGKDWKEITEKQFEKWGVKYDKLTFGKPAGDLYVDDKAFSTQQVDTIIKIKASSMVKIHKIIDGITK